MKTTLGLIITITAAVDIIISLSCFFIQSNPDCIEMVNMHWFLFVYSCFIGIQGIRMTIDGVKQSLSKSKHLSSSSSSPSLMFSDFGIMTIKSLLLILTDLIVLCIYFTFASYHNNKLFRLFTWIVYLTLIIRIFVFTIQWNRITSYVYYHPKQT